MNIDQARQEATHSAQTLLKQRPVYLDTETTGLDPSDEIVELALLDFDGRVLLETLIRPGMRIPAAATRVHRITDGMVAAAPTWAEAWPQISTILAGRITAIYNAEFDTRLMKQSSRKANLTWMPPYRETFCLMRLYARYHGEWNEYRQSFAWQSLENAARQCRIDLPNTHRAKEDALLARAVLHAMAGEEYVQPALL